MSKREIMLLANRLIEALLQCDDGDFVNEVTCAVSYADQFDEDEINDWSEEE